MLFAFALSPLCCNLLFVLPLPPSCAECVFSRVRSRRALPFLLVGVPVILCSKASASVHDTCLNSVCYRMFPCMLPNFSCCSIFGLACLALLYSGVLRHLPVCIIHDLLGPPPKTCSGTAPKPDGPDPPESQGLETPSLHCWAKE